MNAYRTTLHLLLMLTMFVLAPLSHADNTAPEAAQSLVVDTSTTLLNAMKARNGEIKQNPSIAYELVEDIVLPHIDFHRISRLVLGKYWRRADKGQRTRFTNEFKDFLVRTYVTAMIEFSDQIISHADNVRYLPFRNDDPEDVTVRMEIKMPDRPPVSVVYRLYLNDNAWQIYDLTVEGISLATTYRSSFASAIRRGGIEKLISRLANRNKKAAVASSEDTPTPAL